MIPASVSHEDGQYSVAFTLAGAPRTKKNHNRLVWVRGGARIIPSRAFMEWHEQAARQAWTIKAAINRVVELPVRADVWVTACFYYKGNAGDLNGYQQALGDWLQDCGFIANDRQIVSWDGSRREKDNQNPRIEVMIRWCT